LHGSPIVGTPEVALDTLKKSDLDAVALGSLLVEKRLKSA
jgi:predicted NodU family carbamoyl transferase